MLEGLFRGDLGWENWRQSENIDDYRWHSQVYEPPLREEPDRFIENLEQVSDKLHTLNPRLIQDWWEGKTEVDPDLLEKPGDLADLARSVREKQVSPKLPRKKPRR